jgi:hypothetical protein
MWTSPRREKELYSKSQKILPTNTNEDVNEKSLHHLMLKDEYEPLQVLHLLLLQDLLEYESLETLPTTSL